MKKHTVGPLQRKLLLSYTLLIIIPFFFASHLLSYLAGNNIRDNTMEYISLFTDQVSSNIDSYIRSLDRMSKTAFLDSEVTSAMQVEYRNNPIGSYAVSSYLTRYTFQLNTQQPDIQNVILVNKFGEPFITNSASEFLDDGLFYQTIRSGDVADSDGRIVISGAHYEQFLFHGAKDPVFSISRQIKDRKLKVAGLIVFDMRCSDLERSINVNEALLERGARIVVTNDKNQVVLDTRQDGYLDDNSFDYSQYSANPAFTSFASTSEYSKLSVYVMVPSSTLFNDMEAFQKISYGFIIVLVACLIMTAMWISGRIVRPIKKLDSTMTQVRQGNLTVHCNITTKDEIGNLAHNYNLMIDEIDDLIQNVYYADIQNKQAALLALQQQINPHFLHNTLESIRMKAVVQGDREVAKMIQKLGMLFRITLDTKGNMVKLWDEIRHAQTYLDIQNMRHDNRFSLVLDIPEQLMELSVIKLILQPIVENSIHHGFESTDLPGTITIVAAEADDILSITISDNGEGIPLEQLTELNQRLADRSDTKDAGLKSIGLTNISRRLMLQYGQGYPLQVHSKLGEGTVAVISIPLSIDGKERRRNESV